MVLSITTESRIYDSRSLAALKLFDRDQVVGRKKSKPTLRGIGDRVKLLEICGSVLRIREISLGDRAISSVGNSRIQRLKSLVKIADSGCTASRTRNSIASFQGNAEISPEMLADTIAPNDLRISRDQTVREKLIRLPWRFYRR